MMRGSSFTAPIVWILLLACGPAAARPPRQAAAPGEPTVPPAIEPGSRAATVPSRAAFVCRVDVEIRDAERARGDGASDASATEAHDLAWRRACDDLRARSGLDCEDDARVRVVKRSSSTRGSTTAQGAKAHYEQVFELVGFRLARGEAGSDLGFAQACTAASENACQAALGTACPEGRVVVLKADGDDERSPEGPAARPTI